MNYNGIKLLAQLLIAIVACIIPTNSPAQNNLIHTVDCVSPATQFEFNIAEAWRSVTNVNPHSTPVCGDIDGDSKVEILAPSYPDNMMYVFDGATGASIGNISYSALSSYGTPAVIVDGNKDGTVEVFVAGTTWMSLYEVSSAPGVRPITFTQKWAKSYPSFSASIVTSVTADLDGDNMAEFIVGPHIVSYDGTILATLPFSGMLAWQGVISYTADVDGDGLPEVIVGSDVYKYAGGAATLYARCPEFPTGKDGFNMSADMNLDGNIDLVFNSGAGIVIWTPKTNTVIGRVNTVSTGSSSCPFIGDIDGIEVGGKKYPEFCVNTVNRLYAFTFDGTAFQQKWTLSHSDASGTTMLTLFDFNLDGVVELVYRDESELRIFDGRGSTPAVLHSAPCQSGTVLEMPIVADVTGDGSADIIVTGHLAGGYNYAEGRVFVFEGGATKWASCPPVWNQQMYSPLWVNLDLTIPTTIESQDLDFGQTCTNDVRTTYYNGGPMQAPYVSDVTYCPIALSSDVFIISSDITVLSATSVSITITVGNQGEAVASADTPIRYYQNSISSANVLTAANTTLGVALPPGQTTTVTRTITGLSPMPAGFHVRVLDDGTSFPALGAFSDCDLTNNAVYLVDCALSNPVLNDIAGNSLCAGSTQPAITFSGSGVDAASCTWTNSNPNIGLAASGTGNIPAFTVTNTTGSSITATITVTPVSTSGCTGVPKSFTIEVTPAVVPTITIQAMPN